MEEVVVVEVAMPITITVALHRPSRPRCTTVSRRHIVMGVVATLVITRTVLLPRTLLGRRNNIINTGKEGTADPARTHLRPRTVETLTRMAVGETHHGRCLVSTIGADINLGRRAEADTVEVVEDTIVAVVGVVMVMGTAEEGLTTPRYIRAGTTLAPTIVDIAQVVEAHREDVVEVEDTEVCRLEHGYF